jgi:hypothetical protein
MKPTLASLALILTTSLMAAAQGTVPLKQAAEYRNHLDADGIGLGAAILNEAQQKQRFVTEFSQDYLVLEVALYPENGSELKAQPEQFVLHIAGEGRSLRSENPKVIAASLQKKEESKRDIAVIPHVDIGYESTTRGIDSRTGNTEQRQGGIYTSTGVAVVLGEGSSGANPRNEEVMALELSEKGLPAGNFSKPVAGYLYFRIGKETAKNLNARFELTSEVDGKEYVLPLKR